MNISKVIGMIEEPRGDFSCRIKVLSFKSGSESIVDTQEIKNHFPPDGYVFAPNFFEIYDHKLSSFIEFTLSSVSSKNGDAVLMDTNKECRKVGYRVFSITESIMIGEFSINQSELKNFIDDELPHFYIRNGNFLYGPFKNLNKEIVPKNGKEVARFELASNPIYSVGDKSILFVEPSKIIGKVDCMTPSQLRDWLKNQIRNQQINIDFNSLRKALDLQEVKELDDVRMKRALEEIDQLELSYSELKTLSNTSIRFMDLFKNALKNAEEELKQEYIDPLLLEKATLQSSISKLDKTIEKAKKEEKGVLENLELATKEYNLILKDRERLIADISVHSKVHDLELNSTRELVTYEEQLYKKDGTDYYNLNDFSLTLLSSMNNNRDGQNANGKSVIFQLKDYRCFLSARIQLVTQIAKLSNNCKVIIQQVEPDWLKFEYLYKNGLKQIWESAIVDKDTLHFFVLQDINIASIECYGRPILDLVSGVRTKLPDLQSSWPRNLWIFSIPILISDGYDFGLPLIKRTFKEWGFLPDLESNTTFKPSNSDKILQLETLLNHNSIVPNFVTDYFQE